jgi:hypothetical protein
MILLTDMHPAIIYALAIAWTVGGLFLGYAMIVEGKNVKKQKMEDYYNEKS